jgi:hypothetical protein
MNDMTMPGMDLPEITHQFGAFEGSTPGAIPALIAALATASGQFKPVEKNKEGKVAPKDPTKSGYTFKYANLVAYVDATREALAANGLVVTSAPMRNSMGQPVVRMYLMHSSGGYLFAEMAIPHIEADFITRVMQAFGTATEFIRRILYKSLLNLVADDEYPEDDDRDPDPRASFGGDAAYPKHPDMTAAKSIGELSRVMQGLEKADKAKYSTHFNACQAELAGGAEA